mmetsp:Transcript_11675/g.38462  ORF Transcript_11675/g.38462 Transcript_11675/m.38462 type:complete len:232 (-) Transcript_11675:1247-1942(-)
MGWRQPPLPEASPHPRLRDSRVAAWVSVRAPAAARPAQERCACSACPRSLPASPPSSVRLLPPGRTRIPSACSAPCPETSGLDTETRSPAAALVTQPACGRSRRRCWRSRCAVTLRTTCPRSAKPRMRVAAAAVACGMTSRSACWCLETGRREPTWSMPTLTRPSPVAPSPSWRAPSRTTSPRRKTEPHRPTPAPPPALPGKRSSRRLRLNCSACPSCVRPWRRRARGLRR